MELKENDDGELIEVDGELCEGEEGECPCDGAEPLPCGFCTTGTPLTVEVTLSGIGDSAGGTKCDDGQCANFNGTYELAQYADCKYYYIYDPAICDEMLVGGTRRFALHYQIYADHEELIFGRLVDTDINNGFNVVPFYWQTTGKSNPRDCTSPPAAGDFTRHDLGFPAFNTFCGSTAASLDDVVYG